jgi:hypothetical protein
VGRSPTSHCSIEVRGEGRRGRAAAVDSGHGPGYRPARQVRFATSWRQARGVVSEVSGSAGEGSPARPHGLRPSSLVPLADWLGRLGRCGAGGPGSGVQGGSSIVQIGDARETPGSGSRVRGTKLLVQKARAAARGSGSVVRATGCCMRVRVPWRSLVNRTKSLAQCHKPVPESRAATRGGNVFRQTGGRQGGARPNRVPDGSESGCLENEVSLGCFGALEPLAFGALSAPMTAQRTVHPRRCSALWLVDLAVPKIARPPLASGCATPTSSAARPLPPAASDRVCMTVTDPRNERGRPGEQVKPNSMRVSDRLSYQG